MPNLSRRAMLRKTLRATASVMASTTFSSAAQKHALKTIGVQLYTVRDVLPQHPLEILQAIEAIGYRQVEITMSPEHPIWNELKQTKLKPVSAHVSTDLFEGKNTAKLGAALEEASKNGVEFIVYPYVAPANRDGIKGMKKLAKILNEAGQQCKQAGLRLCYHNHAFEFEPIDGTTPLAVLMHETQPDRLGLELDVFWASVGGNDPVTVLKHYSSRVQLLHLKDKAPELKVQYNETVPSDAFREVGHGSLDYPAILQAAATTRVEHYFVEQDKTPGDPLASLKQSYEYLSHLKF
jgi:sugar phosphate isomerase/epimerase